MSLRRTAVVLLALALALAPALAACGGDRGGLTAGDVVPARDDAQFTGGTASYLELPIGRLEVRLGEPVDRLDTEDTRELEDVAAPEGSMFVPITWQYDAGTFMEHRDYLGETPSPAVDLVSDGAEYRVPAPGEQGRGSESFYVVVSGKAQELGLQVDFDGVAQMVDLRTGERKEGRAAPLYDVQPLRKKARDCAGPELLDGDGTPALKCTVGKVTPLPYAAGRWAEEGSTWLTFTVTTDLLHYTQTGSDPVSGGAYFAESVRSKVTVDGQEPASAAPARESICPDLTDASCMDMRHVVVEAADKSRPRLAVEQTYQLQVVNKWNGYDGKDRIKIQMTSTAPVR